MQKLNHEDLKSLKNNPEAISSAKMIADQITKDLTLGGVFPKGNEENFVEVDYEKFKDKWCGWWPVAKILLIVAKVFTRGKVDEAINRIIEIGDDVC